MVTIDKLRLDVGNILSVIGYDKTGYDKTRCNVGNIESLIGYGRKRIDEGIILIVIGR